MTSYLNLSLVQSLDTVLKEGSFRRAAQRLHITAPAMTQQIKRLENQVGYTLVDRNSVPLKLTPEGERFIVHAREALRASSQALQERPLTNLNIGFISGFPRNNHEEFLLQFYASHPQFKLDFVQLPWGEQITALLSGHVDASLARPPFEYRELLDEVTVHEEPRVVAVAKDSAAAGFGSLVLENIKHLPVVRARGASEDWTRYWAVDPRPDRTPVSYGPWASTMEEALTAVAMSDTILMTAASVAERYTHENVVYLPLDDVPYCKVKLCTRKGDDRSEIDMLRQAARTNA